MARTTTTVYFCDGCGKNVERPRDLTKITLEFRRNGYLGSAVYELCDSCLRVQVETLPEDARRDFDLDYIVRDGKTT